MATLRPAGSLLLLLVVLLTFDQGVHAHFKAFKNHFDNPEECVPGTLKGAGQPGGMYAKDEVVEVPLLASGGPCIIRKTFARPSGDDAPCSGEPVQTVQLQMNEDCWHVPNTSEYYKMKCDTDYTVAGRMLCNKGCIECVETNFRTGSSSAFNEILDAVGLKDKSFQGVPVNGSCVSVSSGGAWTDGRDGGTLVTIDYQFEGFCVGKPYEGLFDDPNQWVVQFVQSGKAPQTIIWIGAIIAVVAFSTRLLLAQRVEKTKAKNALDGNFGTVKNAMEGTQDVMLIFTFLGAGLFFMGMFVLDSLTAVGVGFFSLFLITAFEALHSTFCGISEEDMANDDDDDGDLHDPSGAVIHTKYLDFEVHLANLIILVMSQFILCVLLATEMFNYWDDEGAEYDKDFGNLEARNAIFFMVSILLQPGQYAEMFGNADSSWTRFYLLVSADSTGDQKEVIQRWIEVFDPKKGSYGYWEDLDVEKHPKWERFLRWFLMAIGGFMVPMWMLLFTPVLLTFSGTALDFVMNAFALAFIGAMDNGDPIRFRVTKDTDQQAEGREEHSTKFVRKPSVANSGGVMMTKEIPKDIIDASDKNDAGETGFGFGEEE